MARWRYNGKPIKKILEMNTDQMRTRIKLEPGDMIQHLGGELSLKYITNGFGNSTMGGNTNHRFSILHTDYIKKDRKWKQDLIQMIGLDEGYMVKNDTLVNLVYDPYMRAILRIFPVDIVDQW